MNMPQANDAAPVKIFVLDDEPDIVRFLTRCLLRQGYAVEGAERPEKALDLISRSHYDLVLTDFKMPGMDGIALTKRVKESSPDTEVILMTGFASVESAVGSMKLGAFDYITKPFDIRQILGVIHRALLHRQANSQVFRYQDMDRMKEEFLSNISHELRTPLTCIKTASSLLMNEYEHAGQAPSAASAGKMLNIIHRSSDKMVNLVDDLLDTFRLKNGKTQLRRIALDARRVVAECVEECLAPCQERGLQLESRIAKLLPPLEADPLRLRQAILNLLGNAMKFTPAGGRIELEVAGGRNYVEFIVRDNGIGIPEDLHDKVFEKFYQADGSYTREKQGLGLGLALVKSIAALHGGTVSVESAPGKGSAFTLRLPTIRNADETPAEPRA